MTYFDHYARRRNIRRPACSAFILAAPPQMTSRDWCCSWPAITSRRTALYNAQGLGVFFIQISGIPIDSVSKQT
jgi:hypothetical protein